MKALCTKVRKRYSVNKIFDALERLVKCQMRTQNRCLAIDNLKKTVPTINKALPAMIPLVQASLTSYGLQRFFVQVDMGTTMYDVSSHNPQTVEPIPPNGVDHAVYDGSPSHMLDGFVPPAEVQDMRMQTATVRVLPATGYAGMPQHHAFFDPIVDADDLKCIGYRQFLCSCGHARFGQPCRHYVAVLHRESIPVFFHMGLFHQQWFPEQKPYVEQVEMVQPSQPHLAVVGSTIHRPMPTPGVMFPRSTCQLPWMQTQQPLVLKKKQFCHFFDQPSSDP